MASFYMKNTKNSTSQGRLQTTILKTENPQSECIPKASQVTKSRAYRGSRGRVTPSRVAGPLAPAA